MGHHERTAEVRLEGGDQFGELEIGSPNVDISYVGARLLLVKVLRPTLKVCLVNKKFN